MIKNARNGWCKMKEEISLYDILKQLYSISGILIDVYSLDGESLARYPDRGAELCRLVNEDPRGCVRCGRANQEGFARSGKSIRYISTNVIWDFTRLWCLCITMEHWLAI